MKSIIIFLMAMHCITSFGQNKSLSEMNEAARNKYLIKLAKEATKNFGPEWYRKNLIPEVVDTLTLFNDPYDKRIEVARDNGRYYYIVKLFYDEATQKELIYKEASKAYIWADTGELAFIFFGNEMGFNFHFISYRSQIKAGVTKENQIPFQKIEPPHIEPDGTLVITLY